MADKALQEAVANYNASINNNFDNNWGSLMTFLGDDTDYLTRRAQGDISKAAMDVRQIMEQNLQNFFEEKPKSPVQQAILARCEVMKQKQLVEGLASNKLKTVLQTGFGQGPAAGGPGSSTQFNDQAQRFDKVHMKTNRFMHQNGLKQNNSMPLTRNNSSKQILPSGQAKEILLFPKGKESQTIISDFQNLNTKKSSKPSTAAQAQRRQLYTDQFVDHNQQFLEQEFDREEKTYVYKSHKKILMYNQLAARQGLNYDDSDKKLRKSLPQYPRCFNPKNVKSHVQTRHSESNSNLQFGKNVSQSKLKTSNGAWKDPDLAIENADLVPHTNVLQYAVKNYRELINKDPVGKKDKKGGAGPDEKPPHEPITSQPGGDMGYNSKIDKMYNHIQTTGNALKQVRQKTNEKQTIKNALAVKVLSDLQKQQVKEQIEKENDLEEKCNFTTNTKYGSNNNMSANSFIRQNQVKKWIHSRRNDTISQSQQQNEFTKRNVEFARDLFASWDENLDGNISEYEIVKPLVSLGLAPDSKFAKKICQALDPRTRAQKDRREEIELTADEFEKIFRNDKLTEQFMRIMDRENEKRMKHNQQSGHKCQLKSARAATSNIGLERLDQQKSDTKLDQITDRAEYDRRRLRNLSISYKTKNIKSSIDCWVQKLALTKISFVW